MDISCLVALRQIPFAVVFTKTDKRKKKTPSPQENMDAFEREMLKTWEYLPPVLATSSETGEGRLELLSYIAQIRELFKQEHL